MDFILNLLQSGLGNLAAYLAYALGMGRFHFS